MHHSLILEKFYTIEIQSDNGIIWWSLTNIQGCILILEKYIHTVTEYIYHNWLSLACKQPVAVLKQSICRMYVQFDSPLNIV